MNKHQRRYDLLQQIGCIACSIEGAGYAAPDCHHIVEGNKRLGDEYTLPLCPWHHRGVLPSKPGPSLAKSKREFVARYGTERELLEKVDRLIRLEQYKTVGYG